MGFDDLSHGYDMFSIGYFVHFFYTDFPILNKSFELHSFMRTVLAQENHIAGFFVAHTL